MRVRRWIVWGLLSVVVLAIGGVLFGFRLAGYRAYIVHTGSMSPTLIPGDLIIDRPASDGYRPGDIITFRHSTGPDLVTHRIMDLSDGAVHTKGDANETADVWDIPPAYVAGVVDYRLPGVGYAVVFLRQPTGFASVAVTLISMILLWQLFFPTGGGSTDDELAARASAADPIDPHDDTDELLGESVPGRNDLEPMPT